MEQAEATKTEAEKKLERILKLIKRRNRAKKEPELVGLVEDFHKQYQLLCTHYDHLTQESGPKALNGKGNESCSYYASSSDSEYYSSEDIEIKTVSSSNRISHRRMASNLEEELKKTYIEVADLKHQLASKTEEKEALASDHLASSSKIREIEAINRGLRKEVDEKEKKLLHLETTHKGRIAELEEQLAALKTEMESRHHQKRDMEAQLDCQIAEPEQQGVKNKALHAQISEVGDEVTKLVKQIKDIENNLTSKIEELIARVSNLKKEVDYLRARKCEAEGSIARKSNDSFNQANAMKQELDCLCSKKTELEIQLERNSKEISQYVIQVKTLKEELARKSALEQIMVEEKEGLQVQVMDLESEVDDVREQKNKSEDEVRNHIREINQLREEKGQLNARILELEAIFRVRGLELSPLQEDSKSKWFNETDQMNTEAELLQQKLDSITTEKSQLELQIADQQRMTKEREESTNKSIESNSKLARQLSSGSRFDFHLLEKKMEDLAQEFHKKVEDNIRLLYQRITVAEKIHYDNEEMYKKIKERLQQENEALEQKLATCKAEFRKLSDTTESGKNATTGSNSVVDKLEDKLKDGRNSLTRISNAADELVCINDCDTGRETGVEQLKNVDKEMDKEKEEAVLREKVLNLEANLREESEEKLKLLKAVDELENRVRELEKIIEEKDETLLGREEEKREAIRQLCLLIDYQRSCCDHLKELISNLTVRLRIKKKS